MCVNAIKHTAAEQEHQLAIILNTHLKTLAQEPKADVMKKQIREVIFLAAIVLIVKFNSTLV